MATHQKNHRWFLLGREPLLSLAELTSVLSLSPSQAQDGFCPPFLITPAQVDAPELIRRLGGTIKIGVELGRGLTEAELVEAMTAELENVEGKINFGISAYGELKGESSKLKVERWGKEIKKRLKEKGLSVRYVYNREAILSSVTVSKNGLDKRGREFLITRIPPHTSANHPYPSLVRRGDYALAKTLAVQPFEDFSARDFGRPGRDDASGMLPPKLAMMMINLAVASLPQFKVESSKLKVLDPFCGSGTILTEAMLLGYGNLIGSDVSEKAIEDTKKNVEWTRGGLQTTDHGLQTKIFQSDIQSIATQVDANSIDAIVTEPYLGPPLKGNETEPAIKKTISELGKLYCDAFVEFKKVLKPGGVIVFIIPRFKLKNSWYTISDKVVAEIERLKFKPERLVGEKLNRYPFVLYHRPGQFVGREIWRFRLN